VEGALRERHWAQIPEVTFVAGIKFMFTVFRLFGRWGFRVLIYPVVLYYALSNPFARTSSRTYLTRVYRRLARDVRDVKGWMVFRHFVAFAECILDKVRVWGGEAEFRELEFHDQDVVSQDIANGRGGLIITAHLGNMEMTRGLLKWRKGVKVTVLVHTKHSRAFNALLAELNPESGLNLWQVTDISPETAIRLGERVARGEFVVIAGDRVPVSTRPRVAIADFFGEPAPFPVGPYVLASVLQCPTYLLYCIERNGAYHVYYERFRERISLRRRDREATFRELAAAYSERLMHFCQVAPLQWFNFYDFWSMPRSPSTDAMR
jgi:predicted LPLAT superfamily acyltransferase